MRVRFGFPCSSEKFQESQYGNKEIEGDRSAVVPLKIENKKTLIDIGQDVELAVRIQTPYGLLNSGEDKLQLTPFWGGPKPCCSDGLRAGIIESHNFFCLQSYPGEISHLNSPNRKLSNDLLDVVVRQRKVALHTSSHLTPTEA